MVSEVGTFDGDLALRPQGGELDAGIAVRLDGTELVAGTATVAVPLHPFDPAAWTQLGRRVLARADIAVKSTQLDPLLAKLHVAVPYHARAEAHLVAAAGAETIRATVDVHDLHGGILKQPLEVHAETTLDATGLVAIGSIRAANTELVQLEAKAPITLDRLALQRDARLDGTIRLPDIPAKTLIGVIGRGDVVGGTVGGTITIAGTVGTPTATVDLVAKQIELPGGLSGRKPPILTELAIKGAWDGEIATLHVAGSEAKGSLLDIVARGKPRHRETLVVGVTAVHFDLAPVAAFGSGAISAARGMIDAGITLKGLDPDTGDASGRLVLTNGRIPLSPLLGTLRSIDAQVDIANHRVTLSKLDAKLGRGTVHAAGRLELVGSEPRKLHVDATLEDISLVRAYQPTLGANVAIDLATTGTQWTGAIVVSKSSLAIVKAGGAKLLDASLPADMVFVDEGAHDTVRLAAREPPTRPWLVANLTVNPTSIEILQDQFQIRGSAGGELVLSLGQGSVGLDGSLEATRADIDLLGSRSQLERGELIFDGSVDPLLNIRIARELESLTVTAQVSGRASKPEVELSSDSGNYTQGELYSFFVGGQAAGDRAGGDAAQAGYAAGAGVGSSYLSKQINEKLRLPIHLDFNYEVATATSSEGIRVGYWYSPKLFLAGRSHPEARVDENSNEVLFEYHLKGNTLIQGTLGDRGYEGADFVRRWRW